MKKVSSKERVQTIATDSIAQLKNTITTSSKVRISTYFNPLGLELGELIQAKRLVEIDWDFGTVDKPIKPGKKRLFFSEKGSSYYSKAMKGRSTLTVIGVVKRALGTYSKGYVGERSSLKVSHYVWLYECRTTLKSKPVYVLPEDVVLCD